MSLLFYCITRQDLLAVSLWGCLILGFKMVLNIGKHCHEKQINAFQDVRLLGSFRPFWFNMLILRMFLRTYNYGERLSC